MMTPHHIFLYLLVEEKNGCIPANTRRSMSETYPLSEYPDKSGLYEIRLKGHLDVWWSGWFGGLTITLEDNGDTLLTGSVVDQAALHGLLKRVRDLGIPLLSVNFVSSDQAKTQENKR
jgi:hypothetical protein